MPTATRSRECGSRLWVGAMPDGPVGRIKRLKCRLPWGGVAGPRTVDYLQPDETPLLQQRRHPFSAVDEWLSLTLVWSVLTAVVWFVSYRVLPERFLSLGQGVLLVLFVVAASMAVMIHWRRATSLYTITDDRVYKAYGRIRFHLLQTTYDKVTDLHVHQSLFGRMWGYGTVRVQTAGAGLALVGVRDPIESKKRIESTRRAFLDSLVQRSPRQQAGDDGGGPGPEARSVWTGRPSLASFLGGATVAAIIFVASLGALVIGLVVEARAVWGALFLFVLSTWMIALRTIQYRYTGFEVTDQGTVLTRGWLSRRRVETTFNKVTDVRVDQDILGRLFGYGTITINTAGSNEAPVVFRGVRSPDEVKAIIDSARQGGRRDDR